MKPNKEESARHAAHLRLDRRQHDTADRGPIGQTKSAEPIDDDASQQGSSIAARLRACPGPFQTTQSRREKGSTALVAGLLSVTARRGVWMASHRDHVGTAETHVDMTRPETARPAPAVSQCADALAGKSTTRGQQSRRPLLPQSCSHPSHARKRRSVCGLMPPETPTPAMLSPNVFGSRFEAESLSLAPLVCVPRHRSSPRWLRRNHVDRLGAVASRGRNLIRRTSTACAVPSRSSPLSSACALSRLTASPTAH
jgi:hypothetical protein